MILIILYSCLHGRKGQILSVIRNKIKNSVLTNNPIEDMFKILSPVIAEYFSSVLEIASTLLRSIDQIVANFAVNLYKECFIHYNFLMKQTVVSIHILIFLV